ncbi:sugar phosphate nucleotidyltransferase [Candidatus Parabeggiatoa sp. HSG14]|uniref:sugar phosphate nucleotidyltransferase n=1 Tax=Candidatus Parabeggiatoa sp. HSG14 TaxID=3055593 RepID=UPI0025A84873|nr:sugar phosphate nucleotidyltransferase [Thiotrichales bacterium HSG14]
MKAILFADRNNIELQPLTHKTCIALLPIAAKPLIDYSIELLFKGDIHEVIIIISAYANEIENYLGNGERWGMHFDYVLSREQEEPASVLARLGAKLNDHEYLIIRADILRSFRIRRFLKQAMALEGQIVATINESNTGICLLRKQIGINPWQASNLLYFSLPSTKDNTQVQHISSETSEIFSSLKIDGNLFFLDSLKAYHDTNLTVSQGNFPTFVLPVRSVHKKLQKGYCSDVPEHNEGLVGAFCRVHTQATLLQVVLSDEVIVDRNVQLKNTVVLPESYIGPGIKLQNAIVWGNLVIQVDSHTVVFADNLLLANFEKETISIQLASKINRSLGLFTCFISLPLWPLALLATLLQNPRTPLEKIKLRGNLTKRDQKGVLHSQDFIALEWATSIPLLRHLPKLFAVISGQLCMVGVSPQTPTQAEARTEAWEKVRDDAPVGLIGPSQLTLSTDAPIEERLIVEGYYARTRHVGIDILWLLRGLFTCFTKRAWLGIRMK